MFDDPNLVSSAGLVPVLRLARSAGLQELAQTHLSVPTDKGAHAGLKVTSLVAGMVAGADSIDDMALLRHGAMARICANAYAPSTLGSFLRSFTFGHVRQLDAVASRFLTRLAAQAPLTAAPEGTGGRVMVDIDDTIIEVYGYSKQGSACGTGRTLPTSPEPLANRVAAEPCQIAARGRSHALGRIIKPYLGDWHLLSAFDASFEDAVPVRSDHESDRSGPLRIPR